MEEKKTCTGNHKEHLCFRGSALTNYGELNAYKVLVRDPEFICQNCGRVAKCAENLCNPAPL